MAKQNPIDIEILIISVNQSRKDMSTGHYQKDTISIGWLKIIFSQAES
jgi:hypothetical protein